MKDASRGSNVTVLFCMQNKLFSFDKFEAIDSIIDSDMALKLAILTNSFF